MSSGAGASASGAASTSSEAMAPCKNASRLNSFYSCIFREASRGFALSRRIEYILLDLSPALWFGCFTFIITTRVRRPKD